MILKNKQQNTINLDQSLIIGEGKRRIVYPHPQDQNKCIKVSKKSGYAGNNESYRDISYFIHLKNRHASLEHITKFYNKIDTNKGQGVVFEMVRDFDNTISKTIGFYLDQEDENLNQKIIKHMLDLKNYLLNERIVFVDISPGNILLQKINNLEIKLIIADGLSSGNLIPISHYIKSIAHKTIIRRWDRTMQYDYKNIMS